MPSKEIADLIVEALSPKQRDLVATAYKEITAPEMYLAIGAQRSGKTFAGALAFLIYTQRLGPQPPEVVHLLSGYNRETTEVTLVKELEKFSSLLDIPFNQNKSTYSLIIGDQKYLLKVGQDESSKDRLMGLNIRSVLQDEASLTPKSWFDRLSIRPSFPDSKIWVLTNPDHPSHWLKKDYLDKGKFQGYFHFLMPDNPSLDGSVIQRTSEMATGAIRQRLFEGLWAAHEGTIYPSVNYVDEIPKYVTSLTVAVDPASTDPYAALYIGKVDREKYVVLDEYYSEDKLTASAHAKLIVSKAQYYKDKYGCYLYGFVVDPAMASHRLEYSKLGQTVHGATNTLYDGIVNLRMLLEAGNYSVYKKCIQTSKEFDSYIWDPNRPDTPIDDNNHAMDCLRYHSLEFFPLLGKMTYF